MIKSIFLVTSLFITQLLYSKEFSPILLTAFNGQAQPYQGSSFIIAYNLKSQHMDFISSAENFSKTDCRKRGCRLALVTAAHLIGDQYVKAKVNNQYIDLSRNNKTINNFCDIGIIDLPKNLSKSFRPIGFYHPRSESIYSIGFEFNTSWDYSNPEDTYHLANRYFPFFNLKNRNKFFDNIFFKSYKNYKEAYLDNDRLMLGFKIKFEGMGLGDSPYIPFRPHFQAFSQNNIKYYDSYRELLNGSLPNKEKYLNQELHLPFTQLEFWATPGMSGLPVLKPKYEIGLGVGIQDFIGVVTNHHSEFQISRVANKKCLINTFKDFIAKKNYSDSNVVQKFSKSQQKVYKTFLSRYSEVNNSQNMTLTTSWKNSGNDDWGNSGNDDWGNSGNSISTINSLTSNLFDLKTNKPIFAFKSGSDFYSADISSLYFLTKEKMNYTPLYNSNLISLKASQNEFHYETKSLKLAIKITQKNNTLIVTINDYNSQQLSFSYKMGEKPKLISGNGQILNKNFLVKIIQKKQMIKIDLRAFYLIDPTFIFTHNKRSHPNILIGRSSSPNSKLILGEYLYPSLIK